MSAQLEVQLIATVTAMACALPGVFLVLRRMALVSDAVSHSILPGIVIAFFLVHSLGSPLLLFAAAITGVIAVGFIELLNKTRLVREDAAIGLVFPAMFSIGVILITRYAGNVHLDTDAVLLGELAFAPFDRFELGGTSETRGLDLGPKALWSMSAVLAANTAFVVTMFKELKIATLDAEQATILGFSPNAIHYALMTVVSITAVGAFNAVGSILVVALMIAPPAAAYILVDRLGPMLWVSAGLGAASGLGGYWLARVLDTSIAGAMAVTAGLIFAAVLLAAPQRGVIAKQHRRRQQRWTFAERMLIVHLHNHEGTPDEAVECAAISLPEHLSWKADFTQAVLERAIDRDLVFVHEGLARLTAAGRASAARALS